MNAVTNSMFENDGKLLRCLQKILDSYVFLWDFRLLKVRYLSLFLGLIHNILSHVLILRSLLQKQTIDSTRGIS